MRLPVIGPEAGPGGYRAASSSAICTALSAAPLRRLSPDTNSDEAVLDGGVAADAADERRVAPGGLQRRRDVGELDARRARPGCAAPRSGEIGRSNSALIDSEWPVKTGTRTHVTDTGEVGELEDLAALVAELLLLVGLERAVVDERAGERHHVERDRPGELGRRGEVDRVAVERERRGAVDDLAHLLVELGRRRPGPRPRPPGRC